MRAVTLRSVGGPDALVLAEVPEPVPGPGEVLVDVAATSFNAVDAAIRAGFMQPFAPAALPYVPGLDVAGTVRDGGRPVIAWLPLQTAGGSAEVVAVPEALLADAPTSVPLADAAALPAVGLAALQSVEAAAVPSGGRALVLGAGGAVGALAVELLRRAGVEVVAVATPRSADRVRALGLEPVALDDVTGEVDALLHLARTGEEVLARAASLVRSDGAVVSITDAVDAVETRLADRGLTTTQLLTRSDAAQLASLAADVDSGALRLDVARRVPLADLPSVHAASDAGELTGKTVVVVR